MTMADVGEADFAVIVFREEDQWEADALPATVTADLDDFVQALRRQPSIGGTIGFAGVDDFFFVAVRVLGDDASLFLSDLTAAADYPLARQVLEALDIPVPADDEELDQVLPAGDISIFADLALAEATATGPQTRQAEDIPVGAVIFDEAGTIIARGRNRREIDRDPTAHA